VLECVVNVSEGRDDAVLQALADAAGDALLDLHRDAHHNRAVLTLVGEAAPRAVARQAVERLDLRHHDGVHPRLGVVDVVPFAPLAGSTMADAIEARETFGRWAASALGVPCFSYGAGGWPSLPELRRAAWKGLLPDHGPRRPHTSAGAICVGARPVLVAYNLWLTSDDVAVARRAAAAMRGPCLRALGLLVGDRVQLSMNLVEPRRLGPADAYDLADTTLRSLDGDGSTPGSDPIAGTELVGLVPRAVLERIPSDRWAQLDLDDGRTIEARLARREVRP
jgi:glutamate formiminotransferase